MQRRDFLRQTGLLTASAFALPHANALAGSIKTYGLQLYSVRDILPADPKGVMTQLAQMGYKEFESFAGATGFLWGMSPKECKAFLAGIGVKMVSTHFNYNDQYNKPEALKKSMDMAAEAGLTYLLCPYKGAQKTVDEWKKVADDFNRVGALAKTAGLKFGYHNHDYSFRMLDGQIPQDILLANTDPKTVMFELDLCWIEFTGQDAAGHLKKYGNRYELCHIKDYKKEGSKAVQQDLGKGVVNYKHIIRTAKDNGMKHFLIEQEEYPTSSIASMKADSEYMKKLVI